MPRFVALPGEWSVRIELSRVLPGPPEVVWELLTDWDHLGDWMLEGSDFEVISSDRTGVGVRAQATISIGGLRTRDVIEVTIWEPPSVLQIAHLGWVQGTGTLELTPLTTSETRLDWREELRNPQLGAIGSLGLTAFRPLMRRVFERDLRVLEGLVRARAKGGLPRQRRASASGQSSTRKRRSKGGSEARR
ncbi:MAG TPA: SRPBCC family protein [Actinomycetota bacterium]|nr:SRPBCC family protein [Actinomycetota bacterium]